MRHKRRGFTLTELLLVIAILVILAGAAVPYFIGQSKKAKIDLVKKDIGPNGLITSALDRYFSDMGSYPTTEQGLKVLQDKPEVAEGQADTWAGPYIKPGTEFKDPWGVDYQYVGPEEGATAFKLSSAGPNKTHGDDDDIKNWKEEGAGG